MTGEKLYYTITEAAGLLSVSKPTLYRLAERKEIPFRTIGSRILIHHDFIFKGEDCNAAK